MEEIKEKTTCEKQKLKEKQKKKKQAEYKKNKEKYFNYYDDIKSSSHKIVDW